MRIRLICAWREAWRFGSVRLALLLAALIEMERHLPALAAYLPEHWSTAMALAIVVARVLLLQLQPEEIKVGGTDPD